jgi:outer membrane protein TolC
MRFRQSVQAAIVAATLLGVITLGGPAKAMQPLDRFVASSRQSNVDRREAVATAEQRDHEATQAWRRLYPTFTARGAYTFNQFESVATFPNPGGPAKSITITPQNQLDGFLTLDVPVVDFSAYARIRAQEAISDAARARADATTLDVERSVARVYYQVHASRAVLAAARQRVDTTSGSLRVTEERQAAGLASDLERLRAVAEVERAKQNVASAEYLVATTERALTTASGLAPEPGGVAPEDDLRDEPALESFMNGRSPAEEAARLDARAQDALTSQARSAFYPAVSATATERLTNATGFADRVAFFTGGVNLTWRLDLANVSATRAQAAARTAAQAREDKTRLARADQVHDAWNLVRSQIATARAARAEAAASKLAAGLARDKYAAGTAIQLDVLEADRRAFEAEVARIQADSDLKYARAALRVAAGRSVIDGGAR